MTYTISEGCPGCGSCLPKCPTNAISVKKGQFWIDPKLCNYCEGYYPEPQCVVSCPVSLPAPSVAKKGRSKSVNTLTVTSPDLFPHGRNGHSFATALVLWEACNILAQGQCLPWQKDDKDKLTLSRSIGHEKGNLSFWIGSINNQDPPIALNAAKAKEQIESLNIRAACMHLIYSAHATTLDKPWEQNFAISSNQIEHYLGLDKRKDLTKAAKLTLIKEIAQQPCCLITEINWPNQGKVKGFKLEKSRLWHLVEIQHHFQEDESGCKHLIGLTFIIRAGLWAKYFLNKQGYKTGVAFYQYSSLPKSLLNAVMSLWQQHEGAARMMLWLLFKTRMGQKQRITVATLMRIAYGEQKMNRANLEREERKRRLRTFESDLAVLDQYGLKPIFDPETYPTEIQPLWAKLAALPDDADEAIEFWINDGSNDSRLTDAGPRGKWTRLLDARLDGFELPPDWGHTRPEKPKRKQRSSSPQKSIKQVTLTGEQIVTARKNKGWSQRELAAKVGKSQSWIRDLENGRFRANKEDQTLLQKLLEIT